MILSPVTIWKKFDLTQPTEPTIENVGKSAAGFSVWHLRFGGHRIEDGERVDISARFSRPDGEEKVPALLLLPDAGEDSDELSDYFVSRGYAVIVPDYYGKRSAEHTVSDGDFHGAENDDKGEVAEAREEDSCEKASDAGNEEAQTEEAAEIVDYTVYPAEISYANYEFSGALDRLESDNAEKSCWMEWAYVALYAAEYLKTREDIGKIGVAGVRLGGEIAWMTLLSPDISCGVAINAIGWQSHLSSPKYGGAILSSAGEEAEAVRSFIAGVEAESYAPFVHCPVLMCCSMEDPYFDCDRAYDTFVRLGNPEGSAIVYSADSGGCIGPNALMDIDLFLERNLKGREIYIPKPVTLTVTAERNGSIGFVALADPDALVKSISIYYAEGRSGQNSLHRAWQCVKKAGETEIKDNRVSCTCEPFAGAEYAFAYASAEFINGFKTVSPVLGKKLEVKNAKAVKSRVISGGEKDGFGVADYKDESIGGIFLERESLPEIATGYGGIKGVCSSAGIRTYRISSPRFEAEEGAALKMDLYSRADTEVKITVETGDREGGGYSVLVPVKGGGKWKRVILRPEELKDEKTGAPLKSFSEGVSIAIRPQNEDVKVPVANVLWL
ncbi:MAG TPA: hypothetical protein DCE65_07675 [Clostridiales bacterium]|nr:hypothetical protein [Clostridiales bacterium]